MFSSMENPSPPKAIARTASKEAIRIRGARQHNLKGIDLDVPLHKLTVVTGVSGSGKSSLAFDTLYAEGERRYVETFSAYTRQFLERLSRPEVDLIEGIPPAVAIDQRGAVKTSRSTVGTMTGLNDYLKLLYARRATPYCRDCKQEVIPEDVAQVLNYLARIEKSQYPVLITAPVFLKGFGSAEIVRLSLRTQGFVRFLRKGKIRPLDELKDSDLPGDVVEVVVDRLASPSVPRSRETDSVEQAFRLGRGQLKIRKTTGGEASFREGIRCKSCGREFPQPTPGLFSFNTPYGACPECRGFGRVIELDLNRVIPDPRRTIRGGAIKPWATPSRRRKLRECLQFCAERGIPVDVPFRDLPEPARRAIIDGADGFRGVRGFFRKLEGKKYKMHVRVLLSRYRGFATCPACIGGRLRPEALLFALQGKILPELWEEPIGQLRLFFDELSRRPAFSDRAARLILDEVRSRLSYLDSVGLGYLSLGRQSRTLSGGEVERVNLTAALGASLVESLFVLDEPSIGLHPRDNARLLEILRAIRDRRNTVLVVEHDPDILRAADHLIDLGPEAGEKGGRLLAAGTVEEIEETPDSRTGDYLSGRKRLPVPKKRRKPDPSRRISIRGARAHNLKGIDVDLPLDLLVAITGVSGSGKSTLLEDVLYKNVQRGRGDPDASPGSVNSIRGIELVDEVVLVDQSPIGRTSRGNPATYIKVYEHIRKRFAATTDAAREGLEARDFSFNVEGGRCPDCAGSGRIDVEMQFLSDVSLPCDACGGKRFRDQVLRVRYRGLGIHEVLELTIQEALDFFSGDPEILEPLNFLDALGLGYLRLGQPINTLSGGEAQRLKLAGRAMSARRERLLFLLDEPTTGLHLADVAKLLEVLQGLVERGHSVIVIEHHLDVIRAADWVVDLGPEGGDGGGEVVAQGFPEEIMASTRSITGEWLLRRSMEDDGIGKVPHRRVEGGSVSDAGTFEATTALKEPKARNGSGAIRIVGARENNLRDITVEIPRGQLVVVTGMSGSGKSSLLYDIVFSEGQRRYLDCLSPYARQFVEDLHRPDLDHLEGIPPAIAIEQRTTIGGRKSTVGTITEIYHFLRLLFARAGLQYCPDCSEPVVPRNLDEIRSAVTRMALRRGGKLLAQSVRGKKGFHNQLLSRACRLGVLEARIDGKWVAIPDGRPLLLARHKPHDIDLVVGKFKRGATDRKLLGDLVDLGLELGEGTVRFLESSGEETVFSRSRSCPNCRRDFEPCDPRDFSFNSRHGACPECGGYGSRLVLDPERLIENWAEPISRSRGGPLDFLDEPPFSRRDRKRILRLLEEDGRIPLEKSVGELPHRKRNALLWGHGYFPGLIPFAEDRLSSLDPEEAERFRNQHGRDEPCPACRGSRLREESSAVRLGNYRIHELARLTVGELRTAFESLQFTGRAALIASPVVAEVLNRLAFLEEVGLGYLTLDRRVDTLSGGEAQRIRLAAQLGSNLRGACYILDEPTIGLHPQENQKLIRALRRLRDQGNSVLVIEHDDTTIAAADHVIELGPGPGRHGGEVVVQGPLEAVMACPGAPTGRYFRNNRKQRPLRANSLEGNDWIQITGADLYNLKGIQARVPLGALTVVTGVSGAGKSTLVREILKENTRNRLRGLRSKPAGCRSIEGWQKIRAVREVDQLPIGRTPRSTPATYVGFWSRIRALFASTPEARVKGYGQARFSFNVKGGRCERCLGQGRIRMEMSFLPDVYIDCDRCRGDRFEPETLRIAYRGYSIAQVLKATVEEAKAIFLNFREIARPLGILEDLGLGYMTLGQASTTLSGGEAERVKLAVELSKTAEGAVLYILDEPTIGLHMLEVEKLVNVLRRLSGQGHAVVVIEHNLEVISDADWIIDLGPGGGTEGGKLLYQGPPAGLVAEDIPSPTSESLREFLNR